jgi:glycosyltransferase involved in cell wall biosynthesis
MASGLPVVAPALPRLRSLVGHQVEGVLYDPATPAALADALASLRDPIGAIASASPRGRVPSAKYSWQAHCARLDAAFRGLF